MADFDPSGSQNPWTDFDETWHGWVRLGPHPTWQLTTLVEVTHRGWSRQICDLSYLTSFFLFYCFFSARAQVAFLDLSARSIRQNACFRPRMCLLGVSANPTKTSPKWAGLGISQPNRQYSKIAIYQSPMKKFASYFTYRFSTVGTIEKVQNYIKWNLEGVTWSTFEIFGAPPYLGNGWS